MEIELIKLIVVGIMGIILGWFLKRGTLENKLFNNSNNTNDILESVKVELESNTEERGILNNGLEDINDILESVGTKLSKYNSRLVNIEKVIEENITTSENINKQTNQTLGTTKPILEP